MNYDIFQKFTVGRLHENTRNALKQIVPYSQIQYIQIKYKNEGISYRNFEVHFSKIEVSKIDQCQLGYNHLAINFKEI